jgi:DNA mismatch repair protein MSH5
VLIAAHIDPTALTETSHILQELMVSSFVPNGTFLVGGTGNDDSIRGHDLSHAAGSHTRPNSSNQHTSAHKQSPSMLILTGPNYSGKSVYLKQVALIVFMAHVGSFVPAESAMIGLTDKILSRLTTRETVSRVQSTFMVDLQQISLALSLATRRSLLVIDEFGKGTESSNGAGLACAVMEYLLNLKTETPKVIGATHFHGRCINNQHSDEG